MPHSEKKNPDNVIRVISSWASYSNLWSIIEVWKEVGAYETGSCICSYMGLKKDVMQCLWSFGLSFLLFFYCLSLMNSSTLLECN